MPLGSWKGPACLFWMAAGQAAWAQVSTDVNIATGLDTSYSVTPAEEWIERTGVALGLSSPEFVEAVLTGAHGRAGVAVFTWSSAGFPLLIGWTLLDSKDDAMAVAQRLEATPLIAPDAFPVAPGPGRPGMDPFGKPRMTDLSAALDFGRLLLAGAPFQAERSVLNIVANGHDNVGEGPVAARDRAVEAGIMLNGVVLNDDPDLAEYFRDQVIGGPGAFVLTVGTQGALARTMAEKFVRDTVAVIEPVPEPVE